jgi:hypothetical protein
MISGLVVSRLGGPTLPGVLVPIAFIFGWSQTGGL